jgi:malonate transporter and related proteins
MLAILGISGPIYLLILAGYMSTRFGLFARADMRVLGKLVINFTLPALLFNALSQRPLQQVLHTDYLLAYGLGSLLAAVVGLLWSARVLRRSPGYQAYFAMGMSCSNSGYMGYPILLLTIGPVAGVALALNMLAENIVMLPLLMTLAERDGTRHAQWHRAVLSSIGRLLRNPMIAAILAGFVFLLMDWHLPEPLARTVTLFAQATSAVALFVIGGTLVGLQARGMRALVAQIAVGKLIVHPLMVLGVMLWLVPVADPQLRTAAVLLAAMPMLGIYSILAEKHGHEVVSAAALLVTTVASFFTINGLLWLLHRISI